MTRPDGDSAPRDDRAASDPRERDPEAPTADAAEQSMAANPGEAADRPAEVRPGVEVGEWDAVEQSIVIDMDDEYDR